MFGLPLLVSMLMCEFTFGYGLKSCSLFELCFAPLITEDLNVLSLKMALKLVSILTAAISVAYCYPTAFQDLVESSSEYCFLLALIF